MKVPVLDKSGKDSGKKADLSDLIYAIEPNDHAIYLDVKQFLANQRQGTHKSKQKWEISGSTRKIKKQKGTGTARAGSIKSPIFRGGGRIFGPQPRDYSHKLNKKVKVLARKSALSYKAKDKSIQVIETPNFKEAKTKNYLELLNGLKAAELKTLVVLSEKNDNVLLSSRNLQNSKVTTVEEISTYDLLHADQLILSVDSIKRIEEILS